MVKVGIPKDGGQNVAVKIIDKKDAQFDKDSLEQEIAIMKKVDHPNCIKLHEVFDEKQKVKKRYMLPPVLISSHLLLLPFPLLQSPPHTPYYSHVATVMLIPWSCLHRRPWQASTHTRRGSARSNKCTLPRPAFPFGMVRTSILFPIQRGTAPLSLSSQPILQASNKSNEPPLRTLVLIQMYMVLDLVTGGELFDRIIARGHYSEKDAAALIYDTLVAIGYLHSVTHLTLSLSHPLTLPRSPSLYPSISLPLCLVLWANDP